MNDQNLPFHGQPLLAKDCFLRKLPICVADRQRLEYDAIVMACDILSNSYNSLRAFALAAGPGSVEIDDLNIPFAIGACWAIVDQLHAIRQIMLSQIGAKEGAGPKTKQLLDTLSVATKMRNKMDHLKENLGNLARRKGPRPPLFGSISYFYMTDPECKAGAAISLFSGAQIGEQSVPMVNPAGRTFALPVGLFQLSAFDETIDIEEVLELVREYFVGAVPMIEEQVKTAVNKYAETNEVNIDELMASARGSFHIVAHLEFH